MASRMNVRACDGRAGVDHHAPVAIENRAPEGAQILDEHGDQALVARALPDQPERQTVPGAGVAGRGQELVERVAVAPA